MATKIICEICRNECSLVYVSFVTAENADQVRNLCEDCFAEFEEFLRIKRIPSAESVGVL